MKAVNAGLQEILAIFRSNPYALETVWLSIITFDSQVREILPLMDLTNIHLPDIVCSESNEASLGAALKYITHITQQNFIHSTADFKGDRCPILFIITNGKPTDLLAYNESISIIDNSILKDIAICTIAKDANFASLKRLTDAVFLPDNIDANIFAEFLQLAWYIFDFYIEAPISTDPSKGILTEFILESMLPSFRFIPPISPQKESPMTRRLLTYICIDTSGSMRGEPIEAVNAGLQALLASLRQNPYALESVHLTITTFDSQIKDVLPLTPLEQVVLPEIVCPESGATFLGGALEHIAHAVQRDRIVKSGEQKGDWRPILIILTDGKPTDLLAYSEAIPVIKSLGFGNIVACAAGPKADASYLKQLTDTVASLDTMDASAFAQFFQWVSAAVASSSVSVGSPSATNDLPPPPPEINIVL